MTAIVLDASAAVRMVLSPTDHEHLLSAVELASEVMAPHLYSSETGNALLTRSMISRHSALRRRSPARRASADIASLFQASGTQPVAFSEALNVC